MIETRIICDLCGSKVSDFETSCHIEMKSCVITDSYDLCNSCFDKLKTIRRNWKFISLNHNNNLVFNKEGK